MEKPDFNNTARYGKIRERCPLCSDGNIEKLFIISRYEHPFKVDHCMKCDFIFMNPPFNEGLIKGFYREEYYAGNSDYSYYDERDQEKYSSHVRDRRIEVIKKYIPTGNFLDIGAAFGGFLRSAKKYYTPYGIEMSTYSGGEAKKFFGGNMHVGTLNDHPFPEDFFSVITMIEVIEHIDDPARAVRECHKLLIDGGLLVIQTANMAGMQARLLKNRYAYFMPGHLSYFTKKNLAVLLRNTGFSEIRVFIPVEFGLMPKLLKSRKSFTSIWDYRKWARISLYHLISKVHFREFAMTSSMVIYAFK